MKTSRLRQRLSKFNRSGVTLPLPILRTRQEVAHIMGLSETMIRRLEENAVHKIIRAMAEFTREQDETPEDAISRLYKSFPKEENSRTPPSRSDNDIPKESDPNASEQCDPPQNGDKD